MGMPSYWKEVNIMHWKAFKYPWNLFCGYQAIEQFSKELEPQQKTKGLSNFLINKI